MPIFASSASVPKSCFVLFVCLATIVPRMPFDSPWTIGGDLSNSFRKLQLGITVFHMLRSNLLPFTNDAIMLPLQAVEGIGLTFLSFLTPWLMRGWLSDRINVPGAQSPGRGLMPWLRATALLMLSGVALRVTTHDRQMWVFKKIADALTFIPVYRTLGLYNQFSSSHARYPGRGTVLCQFVMIGEYYSLIANLADVATKLFILVGFVDKSFKDLPFVKGLYLDNLFAAYSRVLCHGILLNYLDELSICIPSYSVGATSPTDNNDGPSQQRRCPNRVSSPSTVVVETIDAADDNEDVEMPLVLSTKAK